jgi:GDP-L-fucose synthase
MDKGSRIFVAGHNGLVGSAIVRELRRGGYHNILVRERAELELCRQADVERFFEERRPEYVFLTAAKVGGILANRDFPADFIRDNLAIELNVIDAAWRSGVRKLEFLGSSCIYPKLAPQPMREEYLLSSSLEPTNEPYAIAKIAGIRMAQAYHRQYGFRAISLMPTNLYGPGDNFNLQSSHVLPALMRKIHEAHVTGMPEVVIWGSGQPKREFLHVDDMAKAAVYFMRHYDEPEIVNIGTGVDLSICDLAQMVSEVVGFRGRLVFDTTKPDGTPRKLLDVSRAGALGWRASIPLREGIRQTYAWFLENVAAQHHQAASIPLQESAHNQVAKV